MNKQIWVLFDKRLLAAELVQQGKNTSQIMISNFPPGATTIARIKNERIVDYDAMFAVYYNNRYKHWIRQDITTDNLPGIHWAKGGHTFIYVGTNGGSK